jgi:hypothetical protein
MAELVAVAVVLGIVVLVAWPVARAMGRRRSPHDQPAVTDTSRVPPRDPSTPIPGSREHRRRQGKP